MGALKIVSRSTRDRVGRNLLYRKDPVSEKKDHSRAIGLKGIEEGMKKNFAGGP